MFSCSCSHAGAVATYAVADTAEHKEEPKQHRERQAASKGGGARGPSAAGQELPSKTTSSWTKEQRADWLLNDKPIQAPTALQISTISSLLKQLGRPPLAEPPSSRKIARVMIHELLEEVRRRRPG